MLEIPQTVYDQLRKHGEETYPFECCGVLIGNLDGDARRVHRIAPVQNRANAEARDRYWIDPGDAILAMREARADGFEVIGFYHSHPDCPAIWSTTDLIEAHWIGCSYVITAVLAGQAAETRSFVLMGAREEDKSFVEEEVQVLRLESAGD